MAPIWPFNRKKTGAPEAKPAEEKKVVSYEREQGDAQKEKLEDRTHLEDEGFQNAMKILDGN
jgi:hypothetical protein